MMTPERWQQIKELLYEAQQLAPEERTPFLERSCASDRSLRQEVETLLTSSDARSSFLENSPVSVTLLPGTKLGDYEVQKLLGSGGMGEVYRARDLRLRRDVAIKVLPSFLSSDQERLRRFEQEAQAAAALNHPNILAVFQMGSYEGAPYLVSELLEGETLRSQIQRGPLAARKVIDYGVQIAHGLAAAHEKGIVHRDLKPENLFATRDGRIKILDFGLAKLKQSEPRHSLSLSAATVGAGITEPGVVMGTAGYMSPEQVRGKDVDHRTDLFAFGAILYELLTGKRAFQKTTTVDTMSAILNEEPPPVSQRIGNIPPALQRTVHRCLEKSPEQRFQSASDLAFALEALSDSAASSSALRVEPVVKRGWRAAILGIAVILLGVALLVWWQIPTQVPVVEGVRQLTDDAEPKLTPGNKNLLTDGLRIYFAEGSINFNPIVQVSVTGGQTSPVPTRFKTAYVEDIVPDASALLLYPAGDPYHEVQPLPSGEPHSLNLPQQPDSRFLPDRRIVSADGDSLYLSDSDASNRKKLVDVPGQICGPTVAPDGKRIRFTVVDDHLIFSIWEVRTDGTELHQIAMPGVSDQAGEIAGGWTRDGKYFLFQAEHGTRWDLWALPESSGLLHRSPAPVQLTNGPLSYESPVGSREGKQIFAIGSKKRGELVRWDAKSRQFVPYLDGISAVETQVSPDGKWVFYMSYPDHTLWRSRSDGSERVQLTFPPMMVFLPRISPNGSRVAFNGLTRSGLGIYVLSIEGGQPETVVDVGHGPTWSPDGNSLAYVVIAPGKHYWGEGHWVDIHVLDLRTKRVSVLPSEGNRWDIWWPQPNKLVTTSSDRGDSLFALDLITQKWSRFEQQFEVDGNVLSRDRKYLYLFTAGIESKVWRMRASDLHVETVAELPAFRLAADDSLGQAGNGNWIGMAADGSVTFTRDVGSDEIYALDVKWP